MATVSTKLRYLLKTKRLIKEAIQRGVDMPDDTVFRKYPDYIDLIGFRFVKHDTTLKYIPAPRVKSYNTVVLPEVHHNTSYMYLPTPRVKTHHNVSVETSHDTSAKRTVRTLLYSSSVVTLPTITHETEVL